MNQEERPADIEIIPEADVPKKTENACSFEKVPTPLVLVIFGATGDLTARKLFPDMYSLFAAGALPDDFRIVGASRTELSDEEFRARMKKAVETHGDEDMSLWPEMEKRLHYRPIQYDSQDSFNALADFLHDLSKTANLGGNKLFYLAVPPTVYEAIACNLGAAGLAAQDVGYSRIIIEKPFGHDLESARQLENDLHGHFEERQIFRIDHYLAKDTVQNILMLRFANAIFEPLWNRRYIQHVRITAAESLGVGSRAGYYDAAGVLRDMFQNHMMQLLALCAMEPPSLFESERVRDEKNKVYRSLRPFPLDKLDDHLVLGRYGGGMVDGKMVPGYLEEKGVAPDSRTPTFACMKVYIDNWRWQGVPFYISSGKRMTEKRTEIAVKYKSVPFSMFRNTLGETIEPNRLIMRIQPREEVNLTFQAKIPGPMCLRTVSMNFDYAQGYSGVVFDAYAKSLLDCMLGDHTLFWRQDSVELSWEFLTPVIEACERQGSQVPIHMYDPGTLGPLAVDKFYSDRRTTP